MKQLLFIAFVISSTTTLGQGFVSPIAITSKATDGSLSSVESAARIFLNDKTHEFTAVIDIFPAVPAPDLDDSLAQRRKPLQLKLQGQFPETKINFLTVADNGKSYNMAVNCYMNDSTKNFPITVILTVRTNVPDIGYAGAPHYHPRIRFELMIRPEDFGIDLLPFSIKKLLLVNVTDGVINKI